MKKMIIMVALAVISYASWAFDIPSRPDPPRLVNDYIGLLASGEAQTLENKLVEFDRKTGIQIAVVILDDLGGYEAAEVAQQIGERWGIGQKGINNGIVFLIVKYSEEAKANLTRPRHGDWRIAPGYGLEPYITDLRSKEIGENLFIPYAKADRYYEGIDETITGIMDELGEIGWQQRQELEAQKAAKRAESFHDFLYGLVTVVLIGLMIGLIILAYRAYKKAEALRQRKIALKKSFDEVDTEYLQLMLKMPDDDDIAGYPAWALEWQMKSVKHIETMIVPLIVGFKEEFPIVIENNMVRASEIIGNFRDTNTKLSDEIALMRRIPEEIKKYAEAAPAKVFNANGAINAFNALIESKQKEGFKLPGYPAIIKKYSDDLQRLRKTLEDSKLDKETCENADKLMASVKETREEMESYLESKESADAIIGRLDFKAVGKAIYSAQNLLDELKRTAPETNWKDIEKDFLAIPSLVQEGISLMSSAKQENSMEEQKFIEAEKLAKQAEGKHESVMKFCTAVHDRRTAIINAQQEYDAMLKEAEQKIASAQSKCTDSDVEQEAKNLLRKSKETIEKAKNLRSASLIDWILVSSTLVLAKTTAAQSYSKAERDIDDAEAYRRRKREEEDRKRREEEDRARRRREEESSYSYSSHSYSSGSSSSGSSFGGFGGGSFGGGGAGGSWGGGKEKA